MRFAPLSIVLIAALLGCTREPASPPSEVASKGSSAPAQSDTGISSRGSKAEVLQPSRGKTSPDRAGAPTSKIEANVPSPRQPDPEQAEMVDACDDCHPAPDPQAFTDRTWAKATPYMYRIHEEFFGEHPPLPPMDTVDAYYRRNSAKRVAPPKLYPPDKQLRFRWVHQAVHSKPTMVVNLDAGTGVDVLSGEVFGYTKPGVALTRLGRGAHPVRAVRVNLDEDADSEVVIAELGTFVAKDTELGKVSVVDGDRVSKVMQSVGRVAALDVGDLNGDGRPDLVVGEFGWQSSGGLHVLEQGPTPLTFKKKTLDTDAGLVDLKLGDMNGDGRLDIVTAVSQHHERIDLWLNTITGFERQTLFKAPTPLWGLLGLEVLDLDGDGRRDIVHWNGDTLDAPKLASFQGVHWLRNLPEHFVAQQLAELPGAHDVVATDLNGDGHLDLVAVANLPPRIHETLVSEKATPPAHVPLESIVAIEQTGPGRFSARSLLRNHSCFVAVDAGDWDGDGDVDLLLGTFGLGWTFMGHHGDSVQASADDRACRSGGLFWLENDPQATGAVPKGRHSGAERVQALKSVVSNDPEDSRNRVNLGDELMRQGRLRDAADVLKEAIRINPDEEAAYINRALSLARLGRYREAEETCRTILEKKPDFADGNHQLAAILFNQGRHEDALEYSERAVRIAPARPDYRYNLATVYWRLGRVADADSALAPLLSSNPPDPRAESLRKRIHSAPPPR